MVRRRSSLSNPVGYLLTCCRRHPVHVALWERAQEDVEQIARMTVWMLGEGASKIELLRLFRRSCYRLGREIGIGTFYRRRTDNQEAPPCVVCGQPGVYCDPDWGRLCRRHGMAVRKRRERGIDPENPTFQDHKKKSNDCSYPVPRRNREFWKGVWLSVDDESWAKLWEWANGKCTAPPVEILEAVRQQLLK